MRSLLEIQARWGYRRLLRVSKATFHGDHYAQVEARKELRSQYALHAVVPDVTILQALVTDMDAVESMLKENIVQGRLNDKGRYQVDLNNPDNTKKQKSHVQVEAIDVNEIPETPPSNTGSGCACH